MPTQAKVHRQLLAQQRASCATAATISEEPFKQQYLDIVAQCDVALAGLPADDQALGDARVSSVASLLSGSVAFCTLLSNALMVTRQNQPNAIASAVTAEVTRKLEAGELFLMESGISRTERTSAAVGMLQELEDDSNLPVWFDEYRDHQIDPGNVSVLRNSFDSSNIHRAPPVLETTATSHRGVGLAMSPTSMRIVRHH